MKYCWTTFYVTDMDESLRFYQEIVGLSLIRRSKLSPEIELAFMGSGETQIELICDTSVKTIKHSDSISLGFQCESLEELITVLNKKKIVKLSEIIQPNPFIRFFYVLDPNGVKIQFVEFAK